MPASSTSMMLPITAIRPGKNVRGKSFAVDDLVHSFRHSPQIHPVLVRRVPGERKAFEVLAGHRRLKAAQRSGWSHIEAKIVDVDDVQAEVMALEENLRRKAMPDEASAVARLLALYKKTAPERRGGDHRSKAFDQKRPEGGFGPGATARVAEVIGSSARDVQRKAKVGTRGTAELRRALAEKRITVHEAERWAALPAFEQRQRVASLKGPRFTTGPKGDVRRVVDALTFAEKLIINKLNGIDAADLLELQRCLRAVSKVIKGIRTSPRVASSKPTPKAPAPNAAVAAAVHLEPKSANAKLSTVGYSAGLRRPHPKPLPPFTATTSVSIQATCPSSCVFKRQHPGRPGGCYADQGLSRIEMRRLDSAGLLFDVDEVTAEEARQIDAAFGGGPIPQDGARGGRDLRLHVAGDVSSARGARLLAGAASRWRERGGGSIWTYTHRHQGVPRRAWGPDISVLASVESPDQVEDAHRRGYRGVAIVVPKFADDKAYKLPGTQVVVTPCVQETRGVPCVDCRLCFDADRLNTVIGFAVHGQHATIANEALVQLRTPRL